MNRKAVYGILIAVLIPLLGYIYLRNSSKDAAVMPRHYLPDSTITVTKNGKEYFDTAWHQVSDFKLTNQIGRQVSLKDMNRVREDGKTEGKIIVADFFFTHCPTICPNMTRAMRLLQKGVTSGEKVGNQEAQFVQFLSFSIDPERDSVPELKKWADRFQINPQDWYLLTGDRKTIYDFSNRELRMMAQSGGPVDSNFIHSDLFVLLDRNRNVRGYYHALDTEGDIDTATLAKLSQDIVLLSLEKDPKEEFFLKGKLELIAIVFVILAIGLVVLFALLKKEKA